MHQGRNVLALLILTCVTVWGVNSAQAVPADPAGREVTQPDGTKFILHLRGDEFFSWHETEDGYAVGKMTPTGSGSTRSRPRVRRNSAPFAGRGLARPTPLRSACASMTC